MPLLRIESAEDSRLDPYRSLKQTNATRWLGGFVVEGEKLVERLLDSRFPVFSILVSERYVDRLSEKVARKTPVYVAAHEILEDVVGFNFHRGILAFGQREPAPALESLAAQQPARATWVICPDIKDPDNLGAIVRTAAAFGVVAILVGPQCPDPLSRRVLRVSMGEALRLPVLRCEQLEQDVESLRQRCALQLVASVLDTTAAPLDRFQRDDRLALALGNESSGLSAEWLQRCDRQITIPMRSQTDSLNVGVAAGILLYHLTR